MNLLNPFILGGGTLLFNPAVIADTPDDGTRYRSDDYNVGFRFVPTKDITVHSLGRKKIVTNSDIHPIYIFDCTTGFLLASTFVDMSTGSVGDYIYSVLEQDVMLYSGSNYAILVGEFSAIDLWTETAPITMTADFSVYGQAYMIGNLPRNDYSGLVGCQFTPTTNINISSLGRLKLNPHNNQIHTVSILDSSGNIIDSVNIDMTAGPAGSVIYTPFSIALSNGVTYFIVSEETIGGDEWTTQSPVTLQNVNSVNAAHGTAGSMTIDAADSMYVFLDFQSDVGNLVTSWSYGGGVQGSASTNSQSYTFPNFKYN